MSMPKIGPCEHCGRSDVFGQSDEIMLTALKTALHEALEWMQSVLDGLIVSHIYKTEHDSDPRKALHDLISWEVQVALDPAVSESARLLRDSRSAAEPAAAGETGPAAWRGRDNIGNKWHYIEERRAYVFMEPLYLHPPAAQPFPAGGVDEDAAFDKWWTDGEQLEVARSGDGLVDEHSAAKLAWLARSRLSQTAAADAEHVAWIRYKERDNGATTIHLYDSDADGAFKVYREPVRGRLSRGEGRDAGDNHKLDTNEQVFFYEQDFYVLSNFSSFTLQWQGIRFDTSEAAYHWEKFPAAPEVQEQIRLAPSAHEAFKVAESNKDARRKDWDSVKLGIMQAILHAKADQHEYVRRKLLATGTRQLVEDSWRDDYWGWGPNKDGQNWLGRLWMMVRMELNALASDAAQGK